MINQFFKPIFFRYFCNMEYISDRITIDPKICSGKPTIRMHRTTVQTIMEFLTAGDSSEIILEQYPTLVKEDITACMEYATA
jgi:uncharacterized protein (DUF433 family)